MKRLLLSLAIGLGAVASTSAMAATPAFSAQKAAQVKLPDLSFKQVMREFYMDKMSRGYVHIDDTDIESMLHVALDNENAHEREVALMHPVITYPSVNGDTRYLVIIEKVWIGKRSGSLESCHACQATADLYSFKRINDGRYQLVSRSAPDIELSSSWGRIQFDEDDFKKGVQVIGKNLVGSIFENGYSSFGEVQSWWDILHLSETDYIKAYNLGDAGGSNGGKYEETSPLYYSYDVSYQVMPDGNKYYPIKLTLKGDKPTDDYERIEYVNHSVIKKFNPAKKEYQ